MKSESKARILYIPHGGGPLPLLGDPGHKNLIEFLRMLPSVIAEPSSILVISAHWEEKVPTITSGRSPSLIYDYYGFPEEAYSITYPSPGNPELARQIFELLQKNGIDAKLEDERGFDHGHFVPLKIMYPNAQIPCVQLSLIKNLDPEAHIRLGRALAELKDQNILVLGSGFSFHNMNAFFSSTIRKKDFENEVFQQWLIDTCVNKNMSAQEREQRLIAWSKFPSARYCHPREEHLLPLHVCCGLACSPATVVFDNEVLSKRAIGLLW